MTNQPLSPATQAVINSTAEQVLADRRIKMEHIAAAALRAAADQVVPQIPTSEYLEDYEFGGWDTRRDVRNELFAIAAELEAQ